MPKTENRTTTLSQNTGILFLLQECATDEGMNRILGEALRESMHKHEKKLHKVSRKNSIDNQECCSWDGG